jgi:Tfp pilus assembly protein PilF
LSLDPAATGARYNFALALQRAGYLRDAANELEDVTQRKPGDVNAHLTLANLYAQQLARNADARRHYLKVLELDPRHLQAAAIRNWIDQHP